MALIEFSKAWSGEQDREGRRYLIANATGTDTIVGCLPGTEDLTLDWILRSEIFTVRNEPGQIIAAIGYILDGDPVLTRRPEGSEIPHVFWATIAVDKALYSPLLREAMAHEVSYAVAPNGCTNAALVPNAYAAQQATVWEALTVRRNVTNTPSEHLDYSIIRADFVPDAATDARLAELRATIAALPADAFTPGKVF